MPCSKRTTLSDSSSKPVSRGIEVIQAPCASLKHLRPVDYRGVSCAQSDRAGCENIAPAPSFCNKNSRDNHCRSDRVGRDSRLRLWLPLAG